MNQINVKVIASFNESSEIQPLYVKFRHHDEDLTFKVLYSREVPTDQLYINSRRVFKLIAELTNGPGHKYEFTLTYQCYPTLWTIDEKQLTHI